MRELTGFQLEPAAATTGQARTTIAGQQLGCNEPFGVDSAVRPLFAVADAQPNEIVARYSTGECAVAVRDLETGTSIFAGPPGLTTELVRVAARRAGVHLYTQSDCNVYANGPYLVLHASQDGTIQIDTGHSGGVRELLENQELGPGPLIMLPAKKGDSHILELR